MKIKEESNKSVATQDGNEFDSGLNPTSPGLICRICQQLFPDDEIFLQHLLDLAHLKRLQKLRYLHPSTFRALAILSPYVSNKCDMCDIAFEDFEEYFLHLASTATHRKIDTFGTFSPLLPQLYPSFSQPTKTSPVLPPPEELVVNNDNPKSIPEDSFKVNKIDEPPLDKTRTIENVISSKNDGQVPLANKLKDRSTVITIESESSSEESDDDKNKTGENKTSPLKFEHQIRTSKNSSEDMTMKPRLGVVSSKVPESSSSSEDNLPEKCEKKPEIVPTKHTNISNSIITKLDNTPKEVKCKSSSSSSCCSDDESPSKRLTFEQKKRMKRALDLENATTTISRDEVRAKKRRTISADQEITPDTVNKSKGPIVITKRTNNSSINQHVQNTGPIVITRRSKVFNDANNKDSKEAVDVNSMKITHGDTMTKIAVGSLSPAWVIFRCFVCQKDLPFKDVASHCVAKAHLKMCKYKKVCHDSSNTRPIFNCCYKNCGLSFCNSLEVKNHVESSPDHKDYQYTKTKPGVGSKS